MERTAYFLTAWKLGGYYRTYPAYVEDEVKSLIANTQDFVRGPITLSKRGTRLDDRGAFVVEDGNYVSARWPGDAYLLAKKLLERLALFNAG
jgi:putative intracellular protease/amidase